MKKNIGRFIGFVAACVAVAVGVVLFTAQNNAAPPGTGKGASESAGENPIAAAPSTDGLAAPALVTLRKDFGPQINRVQIIPLRAGQPNTTTATASSAALACERAYFVPTAGICIGRTFLNPLTAVVSVTLLGPNLQPRFGLPTEGIPTRARVSADGKYAAYTVFVTGHSYLDTRLSTRTEIIDLVAQQPIGNLEAFAVFTNGQRLQAADFNYWGVTFAADSAVFYATLRTGGINWLVRGDVQNRTINLMHPGVECPSLSPDGTRIAFKKLNPDQTSWRLHVLNLATQQEQPLAETRNVDDQAEWLDDGRVLYEQVDLSAAPRTQVWVTNADGSGTPSLYLADAGSPAVLR